MPTVVAPAPSTSTKPPRPVAVYVRVSTAEQTVEGQEAELVAYCTARGWTPVIFRDVQSGAATSRPGLEKLLAAVRRREVTAVVCVKLDRIGRSLVHLAMIVGELTALRVPILCTTQGIDTSEDNPVGRLQLGVLMAVAEFERSLIRERTLAGLAAARARGARLGRPPKVTPEQWARVLELHGSGQSVRAIARTVGLAASTVSVALRSARTGRKEAV